MRGDALRSIGALLVRLLVPTLLAIPTGCGPSRQLVVVKLDGDRNGASYFFVLAALNGSIAEEVETFKADTTDFGLELPEGASGDLDIDVSGYDANNCQVSHDIRSAHAGGADRLDIRIVLTRIGSVACRK